MSTLLHRYETSQEISVLRCLQKLMSRRQQLLNWQENRVQAGNLSSCKFLLTRCSGNISASSESLQSIKPFPGICIRVLVATERKDRS